MKFNQINCKLAYEWLHEKQALLVEVYKKGDTLKVRHLQISILKDFRTTAIAVRRVTTSSGSRTPGSMELLQFPQKNEMCLPCKYFQLFELRVSINLLQ
jgi:hypothetical protein